MKMPFHSHWGTPSNSVHPSYSGSWDRLDCQGYDGPQSPKLGLISKGTRLRQEVPVSPEALAYLAAYLDEAALLEVYRRNEVRTADVGGTASTDAFTDAVCRLL